MFSNMERIEKGAALTAVYPPPLAKISNRESDQLPGSGTLTISLYENEIPEFVGDELDRLYGNLYSSLAEFRIGAKLRNASTYVVRNGGNAVTVFLFRLEKGRVEVVNEVIRIEQDEINRFANYVFERFKSAQVIIFRAISTDISSLSFRYLRFNYLEDTVADLPDSPDVYAASLGKSTRHNMRRYQKLLMQDFPSFSFRIAEKEEILEQDVLDIIQLSRARMSLKKKAFAINDIETARILNLVRHGGLVGIATINGRVCGGAISYCAGANSFLLMLAHDPEYDGYSLGKLSCFLTICESIRLKHAREFHFLWGRYEYKANFLGTVRDLEYVAIYRSAVQILFNADIALKAGFRSRKRLAALWLHGMGRKDTVMSRLTVKVVNLFLRLRELKPVLPGR